MGDRGDLDLKKLKGISFSDPAKYQEWAFRMSNQLQLQGLGNVLTAARVADLDPDEDLTVFQELAVLCEGSVSTTLRLRMALLPAARQRSGRAAWDALRDEYGEVTTQDVTALNMAILDRKFGPDDTLETYSKDLLEMMQKLRASGNRDALSDTVIRAQILRHLPPRYDAVVHAASHQDGASAVDLLQELRRFAKIKNIQGDKGARDDAVLAVGSGGEYNSGGRGGGAVRHQQQQQRPRQYQQQQQQQQRQRGPARCFFCGKTGHLQRQCRKYEAARKSVRDADDDGTALAVGTDPTKDAAETAELVVDSGADEHLMGADGLPLFNDIAMLRDDERWTVATANGAATVHGIGTVRLLVHTNKGPQPLELRNTLYVPSCKVNLVSSGKLVLGPDGWPAASFVQQPGNPELRFKDGTVVPLQWRGRRVVLRPQRVERRRADGPGVYELTSEASPELQLLHARMGHLNFADLLRVAKDQGIAVTAKDVAFCDACALGKSKKAAIPKQAAPRRTRPGELTHTDVVGPMEAPSLSGARFAVVFVDDATRHGCVFLIKSKDAAWDRFLEYRDLMHAWGADIAAGSRVQSDSDVVYKAGRFRDGCAGLGLVQQFSPPESQAKNGVAEKYVGVVTDMARAMLLDAPGLDKKYWGAALRHAAHVRNLSPTVALAGGTPHRALFGKRGDVQRLRKFGARAFVNVPRSQRRKWDPKARVGVYVGEATNSTAHLVYFPDTGRTVETMHAVFDETLSGAGEYAAPDPFAGTNEDSDDEGLLEDAAAEDDAPVGGEPGVDAPSAASSDSDSDSDSDTDGTNGNDDDTGDDEDEGTGRDPLLPDVTPPTHRLRRSARFKTAVDDAPPDDPLLATVHGQQQQQQDEDPTTLAQARQRPDAEAWEQAYQDELNQLLANDTWEAVPRSDVPPGLRVIGVKPVFRTKRTADGKVDKLKVRVVAKGFLQRKGIDYQEVFAPVAHLPALRTVLACAVARGYAIHHLDVSAAFLNAPITEEVYIELPEGIANVDADGRPLVGRLRKALYGTAQGSRSWYQEADSKFLAAGFARCEADPCVYHKDFGDGTSAVIAAWVDDFVVTAPAARMAEAKAPITGNYKHTDYGPATSVLGFRLEYDMAAGVLRLDQETYAKSVLERFGMLDSKPVGTPLIANQDLVRDPDVGAGEYALDAAETTQYRALVGSLNYLAVVSRPDLAFAVSRLGRFSAAPTSAHRVAAKRVLRYLRGTLDFALVYRRGDAGALQTFGFADASFGKANIDNGKSTSGHAFFLAGAAVAWSSKLQTVVALSTAEAEYLALHSAVREALFLRNLLAEIGLPQDAVVIFEDNQPAIKIATNPMTTQRTKHVALPYHFVRHHVKDGAVTIQYKPTEDMVADCLTKALHKDGVAKFGAMLAGRRVLPGGV